MPDSYPAWPTGAQVQAYLEDFVDKFDLAKNIQLNTEVVSAEQDEQTHRWTVKTRSTAQGIKSKPSAPIAGSGHTNGQGTMTNGPGEETWTFDVFIVANGTFSDCLVPTYPGHEAFVAAGGKVCHTSEFLELEDARGRDVIIVGYGKSACDVAVALSRVANSTVGVRTRTYSVRRR